MILAYLIENNYGFYKDLSYILFKMLKFYGNYFNCDTTGIFISPNAKYHIIYIYIYTFFFLDLLQLKKYFFCI